MFKTLHLLLFLALAACGVPPGADMGPEIATPDQVAGLSRALQDLGPEVDPEEARRAARIAYDYTAVLAREYQITDTPLVHNTKVNMGIKPRGLCYQWADDLQARLAQERFRTLTLHRGIANYDKTFRIEHSTLIVSRRGDDMFAGIVLDPWRKGGRLTWVRTAEDEYDWIEQAKVFAWKLAARAEDAPSRPAKAQ
ncbi:hypothetical protein GE300_02690 [Rhodobacteraceae bacterium 2CG4]|uniref:Lipoprotein n=1 Tax=Halovulum marinum TaxID=2662447 RepID=A0A6L5YXG3_9RHOB|nr:hypothetical protein [Halovulum marinum]MSU88525.1 hypothetical protein [Halovulum marinum]